MKDIELTEELNATIDIYIEYLEKQKHTHILSLCEERGYDDAIKDLLFLKTIDVEMEEEHG